MRNKPKRKRITSADLLVAIDGLDERQRTTTAELLAAINRLDGKFTALDGKFTALDGKFTALDGKFTALDGKLDARTEELKSLIAHLTEEMLNGFSELHAFTEFSLAGVQNGVISRMDRRFDLMDNRFDEIGERLSKLERRKNARRTEQAPRP